MLPDTIKIGAFVWTVTRSDAVGRNDCDGQAHHDTCEIHIDRSLGESAAEDTLIHELLHAMLRFAGIQDGQKVEEEEICLRLGPVLYTTLKENGMWFPKKA